MWEGILEAVIDSLKMLPFLYITYLVMEYLEHHISERSENLIRRVGRVGPLPGAAVGLIPQCGFSAAVAGLYAARVVTLGTMVAVFLSTSDEMLPILISAAAPLPSVLRILAAKFVFGCAFGFLTDIALQAARRAGFRASEKHIRIHEICEREHCECDDEHPNLFLAALKHTLQIFLFILVASVIIEIVIGLVGEDALSGIILNVPVAGELLAGLIGLIPNCAASVVLTELYLNGALSAGALISGLMAASGMGLLVLFRMNRSLKDNVTILGVVYILAVIGGLTVHLTGIVF